MDRAVPPVISGWCGDGDGHQPHRWWPDKGGHLDGIGRDRMPGGVLCLGLTAGFDWFYPMTPFIVLRSGEGIGQRLPEGREGWWIDRPPPPPGWAAACPPLPVEGNHWQARATGRYERGPDGVLGEVFQVGYVAPRVVRRRTVLGAVR